MVERGWGWTASQVRQLQLMEWIIQQSSRHPEGRYVPVGPFYRARHNQSESIAEVAHADLEFLKDQSLIKVKGEKAEIDSLEARATDDVREWLETVHAV